MPRSVWSGVYDFGGGLVAAHRHGYHGNVGGIVADTAIVDAEANIGYDARVYEFATVGPGASVKGFARVYGHAIVSGPCLVTENAQVGGDAMVYEQASVYGHAVVKDEAKVSGLAHVCQNAVILGRAHILGRATCNGHAHITDTIVQGTSMVCGWLEGRYVLDGTMHAVIPVKPLAKMPGSEQGEAQLAAIIVGNDNETLITVLRGNPPARRMCDRCGQYCATPRTLVDGAYLCRDCSDPDAVRQTCSRCGDAPWSFEVNGECLCTMCAEISVHRA